MASSEHELDPETLAAIHDALAHPVRVTVLRVLRAQRSLAMADLRRAVADEHGHIDTRSTQHHVEKMHHAGIVDLERLGGRYRVHLVRDVRVRVVGA